MTATLHPVQFDALRDKTYRRALLGPDVAAFLAWLELGGASPITVDNYERALAVVCRMYPHTPIGEVTDAQLAQVFKRFPARSRRVLHPAGLPSTFRGVGEPRVIVFRGGVSGRLTACNGAAISPVPPRARSRRRA